MHNLYYIESDNHELINIKLKELLKDKFKNLITYDMEEVNISKVIEELDTYSFFNEEKIVYASNATFLTSSKSNIEHDIESLTKYLNNPNTNNILIIACSKMDSKKKIVKLIKDTSSEIKIDIDIKKFIKDKLKDTKMDTLTMEYFLSCTLNDFERTNNELDKLIELTEDKKVITKEDIDKVVIKKIDTNIFELIDAIINKDKKKSLIIYNEMINYGEEVFKIMISLANQIRLIYQVKVLKDLTNEEILDILNLKNIKQIVALRYKINKYKESELIDYLHKLSIIDEDLKLGKCIDKVAFPMFIASL